MRHIEKSKSKNKTLSEELTTYLNKALFENSSNDHDLVSEILAIVSKHTKQ